MVANARGYHDPPFKGFCRAIQGHPLSPTIFKVFVDTVMCHWVMVVAEEDVGPEGLGRSIQRLAAYFCTNDGLITPTREGHLQQDFGAFTDLFDHVGLRANIHKMASMVYQLCLSPGGMSVEAYTRRMPGEGPIYQDRLRRRV